MGWIIALGILTLLAILPLGVSVRYDSDGANVRLIAGPLKITLFPKPKKEEKPKKEKKNKKKKDKKKEKTEADHSDASATSEDIDVETDEKQTAKKEEKKKSGGSLTDFLPLVKTLFEMLGAFGRRLRVNLLDVKVILAGGDPCDLGINYGKTWAAIGNLQPHLEKIFVIKKRKIDVECDFCADKTLIIARLDLTITLGRILATVFVYGIRALMQFLKINKKRKGGAAK